MIELLSYKDTIGFELEWEGADIYDGNVKKKLETYFSHFGTIKADASLKQGFELASNIYHIKDFLASSESGKWEELYNKIDEVGAYDADNTGMHVHVGRAGLTADQILKINYFVFSSQTLMDTIGGRTANGWCHFYRNSTKQVDEKNGPKYCYLNVGHVNTIEFRFFRTPTSLNGFLRNMQFICAMVEFVKRSKENASYFRDKAQDNFQAFLIFIEEHEGCYAHLYEFLTLDNNKQRLEKGEIRVEKAVNCDLYPTKKIKKKIARLLFRYNGNSNGVTIKQLDTIIGQVNPEKAAKTHEYLGRVFARATRRKAERVYFNELPSPHGNDGLDVEEVHEFALVNNVPSNLNTVNNVPSNLNNLNNEHSP